MLETGLVADISLIKAWKGDAEGNLVYRKTARNFNREKIHWMFNCEKARQKMRDAYAQLKPQTDALPLVA